MKIRTRYPALIHGRVKRMSSDKLILCLPEDEFEVRETTSEHAPVGLVVSQHETTTEFRLHDGVLYTRLPETPEKIAKDTEFNPLAAFLNRGHPLFGAMAEEIHAATHNKDASETRPERLHGVLISRAIPRDVIDKAVSSATEIVETETSRASIDLWKEKATKRISELIMIDGQCWQATPEPVYKLSLFSGHASAQFSDIYDNGTKHGHWRDYDWFNLSSRYFSATDIDGMREAALRLGREGRKELVLDGTIEVLLPEALRHDYRDMELDRASRVGVLKIETQLNKFARSERGEIQKFPRGPLLAACQLRDALAYRTPYDKVDDSLAAALENFIEVLDNNPGLASDMDFDDQVPSLRDILDVWCGRDVTPAPGNIAERRPTI
ncbi:hypothetical protein [Rhizobium sp. BK176]|uniref:hypothetical protein n=1 Tax=Rhizobium sp. BK176 TaxID=2587071 RepID=UPI002166ED5C|nr:hypothetical protein [Rhizobium sp. BK176]MCS4090113.1 hypothetical protein [Rhizobium sp. BK176]